MSRRAVPIAVAIGFLLLCLTSVSAAPRGNHRAGGADRFKQVKRFVVIYQENHSFDNLLGGWEGVNGLANAPAERTVQVDQNGNPLDCLIQNDPSLEQAQPPLCSGVDAGGNPFTSHFVNQPFEIDDFVPKNADTCPDKYGPPQFGCTLDIRHSFYQTRYQLNDGQMNRFPAGNDLSSGLAMGYWNTRALPFYDYLHALGHPNYAIADNFYAAAIDGSFLNHQWLIAARTPTWPNADDSATIGHRGDDEHSVVDANGMPTTYDPAADSPSLLYRSPLPDADKILNDGALTANCNPKQAGADTLPAPPPGTPCGDFAVNTINPPQEPTAGKRALLPLQPRSATTIGDRLNDGNLDWAWFSEGWSNANGNVGRPGWTNGDGPVPEHDGTTCAAKYTAKKTKWPFCPSVAFTYHHQPFNYFQAFDRQTEAGRDNRAEHLRDLAEFKQRVAGSDSECRLPRVSYVKFQRAETEHPGIPPYKGDAAVTNLVGKVEDSDCAQHTMVILTYDEYGGAWDHMPPPGQGGTPGPHDGWGPGPRIPAIIVSPLLPHNFAIDDTQYDTTSIMATFERRFGLPPVATRDAQVNDLSNVFDADPGPGSDPGRFRLGKLKRNPRKGTGKLAAYVPGPGKLILRGRQVVPRRPSFATASAKSVRGPGVVRLNIKAKAMARRKLNRRGRARVKVTVTFDPASGANQKRSKTLRLRKRR